MDHVPCIDHRFVQNGLVESLACARQTVVTTSEPAKELVTEGATRARCSANDPHGLADACWRGFELARRPQPVDAGRTSVEPFDWDEGSAPVVGRPHDGG